MAITYKISGITAGVSTPDTLQLWSGMDLGSAEWVRLNGVDYPRMKEYCEYAAKLYTTYDLKNGVDYSYLSVAVNMRAATPAVLGFRIARVVVDDLLARQPALAGEDFEDRAYWFEPESFSILNNAMTDVSVHPLHEITFEEE